MSTNTIKLEIKALPENVAISRVVAAAILAPLDANVGEITDVQTAVSEAVTNAIIHGYSENPEGTVFLEFSLQESSREASQSLPSERLITIKISDTGVGIENITTARQPLFSTRPEMERSGLGFTVMESFMDTVEVSSSAGKGTCVTLTRKLNCPPQNPELSQ